jgi:hypothetical protein
MSTIDVTALFIEEMRAEARRYKELADKALAQADDAAFFATLDAEANSLALLVKHIASNLSSRWTAFYTTDGEKPDRHRDREFEVEPTDTRATLMAKWEAGWAAFFAVADAMTPADAVRTITIRCEPHTVPRALVRSLAHLAGHVGQIVLLAKHGQGAGWKTLTIARGQSEQANAAMRAKFSM